ncbi:MAG: hypothetical protein ACJAVM_000702 [Sulfitobacter sp.]|jgi:hypothetical protein
MAYHDITEPAQVLNRELALTRAVFDRISGFFSALGHALMTNSAGQQRVNRVQRLQAKSDAELATMNLKREDIVHHVFKDLYYV